MEATTPTPALVDHLRAQRNRAQRLLLLEGLVLMLPTTITSQVNHLQTLPVLMAEMD